MANIVFGRVFRPTLVQIVEHSLFERDGIHSRLQDVILVINEAEEMPAAGLLLHLIL